MASHKSFFIVQTKSLRCDKYILIQRPPKNIIDIKKETSNPLES